MPDEAKERPRRPPPPKTIPQEPGTYPIPGMRKVIGKRLKQSMQESPHFYVTSEIDMEPAAAFREKMKGEGKKYSYNDMVLKAAGLALKEHPHVNSYYKDDEVEILDGVHVGCAVAIEEGLTVPVIRDIDKKSLDEIRDSMKDLATRARDGKLQLSEIQGGGFTVSNLGMFDVESFTAIINPPQSAILAVSSIRKVPIVADDEIRAGMRMNVTLSSDHRMVDGLLAAKFLKTFKSLLQDPENL